LSTVYGIIKQGKGHLFVDSSPERGTIFDILLPLVAPPAAQETSAANLSNEACTETILLVEDEEPVLKMTLRTLKSQGYTVLTSRNAQEALKVAAAHRGKLHLLLTDVAMPGMSGLDLSKILTAGRPDLKVLLMSGYPDGRLETGEELSGGLDLLQKPFALSELTARVRRALNAAA
jgi:DNA-binding NtrC family response regulator